MAREEPEDACRHPFREPNPPLVDGRPEARKRLSPLAQGMIGAPAGAVAQMQFLQRVAGGSISIVNRGL
jgi:hypothetical protein